MLYEYARYKSDGFIMHWNLDPDQGADYHLNPIRRGNVRLELKFKHAVKEPVTVLFMSETSRILKIDKNRTVTID